MAEEVRLPTVRLQPGVDDDLIEWMESLAHLPWGAKGKVIKEVLRRGLQSQEASHSPVAASIDPEAVTKAMEQVMERFLVDMRRVVEAALESAGRTAEREPEMQTDEGRALLKDFLSGLSLGEEDTP